MMPVAAAVRLSPYLDCHAGGPMGLLIWRSLARQEGIVRKNICGSEPGAREPLVAVQVLTSGRTRPCHGQAEAREPDQECGMSRTAMTEASVSGLMTDGIPVQLVLRVPRCSWVKPTVGCRSGSACHRALLPTHAATPAGCKSSTSQLTQALAAA